MTLCGAGLYCGIDLFAALIAKFGNCEFTYFFGAATT